MKSVGIICEYNPFHNGHIYHINCVKKLYPDYTIVLVLSGNFTQRGDVSLINKWKKTEIALNYVDLVVELPFSFASQSADIFAKGAISILDYLKVEAIVFGSECNDINKLKKLALTQNNSNYDLKVKNYLSKGFNYPTSMSKALFDICGETVSASNDLLGLSYIKEIKNTTIKPITIQRTNEYLSNSSSGLLSSATSIRYLLKKGDDVSKYVPACCLERLNDIHFLDDYFELLKYRIISDDISKYQSVDEGIEHRIKRVIHSVNNTDELINKVKSKRYTQNRIKRMLIHILVGFTKNEASDLNNIDYIRVLGFNRRGRKYLKEIKRSCSIPIFTKFVKGIAGLDLEARVTSVYNFKGADSLLEHDYKIVNIEKG